GLGAAKQVPTCRYADEQPFDNGWEAGFLVAAGFSLRFGAPRRLKPAASAAIGWEEGFPIMRGAATRLVIGRLETRVIGPLGVSARRLLSEGELFLTRIARLKLGVWPCHVIRQVVRDSAIPPHGMPSDCTLWSPIPVKPTWSSHR